VGRFGADHLQGAPASEREDAVDDERRAYEHAYRLLEAVQGDDAETAEQDVHHALRQAREHGWTQVELVLMLVRCAHGLTHGPSRTTWEHVEELLTRARREEAPALEAAGLGVRAVLAGLDGDTAALLADTAEAQVLLDADGLAAAERSTAYVVVAAAYNSLRLWELVDDLYDRAERCDRDDLTAAQRGAIAVNRALVRLEWSLALSEVGDEVGALHQLARARRAVDVARETPMPRLWQRVADAGGEMVDLLTDPAPLQRADQVDALVAELREAGEQELLPLLEASWALALLRAGHRRQAVRVARRLGPGTSPSSGGSTVPSWVRALVLRGRRPGRRVTAQAEYAERLAAARWAARRAVLDAATAQVDVARRRAERERLLVDATTDALTGLSNRRVFEAWLDGAGTPDQRAGLLLVDLDDFKDVNDQHGHGAGDEVLRLVGRAITQVLRPGDVGLRLGGDEFAVVVPHADDVDELLRRVDALREQLHRQDWDSHMPGRSLTISAGVGWSGAGGPPVERGSLYRRADEDLYVVKRQRVTGRV
jgi:diguanylate cyclase (GGDEF)-like protein